MKLCTGGMYYSYTVTVTSIRLYLSAEYNLLCHFQYQIMYSELTYGSLMYLVRIPTLAMFYTLPLLCIEQLLQGDVDWSHLAQSYELTGGLIRNAVLSAVSLSSMRSNDEVVTLSQSDLHAGAKLQLRYVS